MLILRMLQRCTFRQVAPQRQDVVNAFCLQLLQHGFDSMIIRIDAGKMRHGRNTALVYLCRHSHRFPSIGPAGPVGHADKRRFLFRNGIYNFQRISQLTPLFGRKQLAGHARFCSF